MAITFEDDDKKIINFLCQLSLGSSVNIYKM